MYCEAFTHFVGASSIRTRNTPFHFPPWWPWIVFRFSDISMKYIDKSSISNVQSIRMQNGIILHWTQSAIIAVVVYTRNFTIMREIACVRCEIRAAKFLINVDTRHLPRCLIAVYVYTNMEASICMQNYMWSFSQLVCVMVMCDIHVHVSLDGIETASKDIGCKKKWED